MSINIIIPAGEKKRLLTAGKYCEEDIEVESSGGATADNSTLIALIDRSIEEIEIPEGVETIGECAFRDCSRLKKVKLPKTIKTIGNMAFYMVRSIEEIEIPEGCTTIGGSVFAGCTKLATVKLPESITAIGSTTFNGTVITSFVYPDNVDRIDDRVFINCFKLESVTAPSACLHVEEFAFSGCTKCATYDFTKCKAVPQLYNVNAFEKINANAKILVPADLYDEWVAATNWSAYADYIEAVEGEKFGIIEPTKIYKDACSNGWENIKGLSFDEWKIDTPNEGYYIYGFPLRAGQVKLEVTGGILTSSFTLDRAKPNVFFVRGYNSENGGICVMDAPDVSVYPDNWLGSTIPEKVTIDIPEGLGIDGVYLSFVGNPVVESIDPNAEV